MVQCPKCNTETDQEFGMVTCGQCNAVFMIGIDGDLETNSEEPLTSDMATFEEPEETPTFADPVGEASSFSDETKDDFMDSGDLFSSPNIEANGQPEEFGDEGSPESGLAPDPFDGAGEGDFPESDDGFFSAMDAEEPAADELRESDGESVAGVDAPTSTETPLEGGAAAPTDVGGPADFSDVDSGGVEDEDEIWSEEEEASSASVGEPDMTPVDVSAFADSEASSLEKGDYLYTILLSRVDSKEIVSAVFGTLSDRKLGLMPKEILRGLSRGRLQIPDLNPLQAKVILEQLQFLDIGIRWSQRAVVVEGAPDVDL